MTTPVTDETSVAQGDLASRPMVYVPPSPEPDSPPGSVVTAQALTVTLYHLFPNIAGGLLMLDIQVLMCSR